MRMIVSQIVNSCCSLAAPRFVQMSLVVNQSHDPDILSIHSFTPSPDTYWTPAIYQPQFCPLIISANSHINYEVDLTHTLQMEKLRNNDTKLHLAFLSWTLQEIILLP